MRSHRDKHAMPPRVCGVVLWWLLCGLVLSTGCAKPQTIRRYDRFRQPPERRPLPPPPPRREAVNPKAAGRLTGQDYAMAEIGRWFDGKKKGHLAPSQVTPLIDRAKPYMHVCLTRFQRRFPGSKTTFKLRLWIGPQGKVWKTQYAGDLKSDPRTVRCVRSILHKLRFLAPGGFFVWTQMVDWHRSSKARR